LNDTFFTSAPQLKRGPLGGTQPSEQVTMTTGVEKWIEATRTWAYMPWNILRALAFLIAVGTGVAFVMGGLSAPELFAALTTAALLWLLARRLRS